MPRPASGWENGCREGCGLFETESGSIQNHAVIHGAAAAGLREQVQKLLYGQVFLFFSGYINDDLAFMHHDQAIAMGNGIAHVVWCARRRPFLKGERPESAR